jgi:WD40 repeat protein
MNRVRLAASTAALLLLAAPLRAQDAPSYAKDVRPFLAKYCLECHNAKNLKGRLNLESYDGLRKGSSSGEVLVPGKPDESAIVLQVEGKDTPHMPPKEARQPKAKEIGVLRAWVAAGARDDSATVKITLPEIRPTRHTEPPVTALAYRFDDKALAVAGHHEVLIFDTATNALINKVWKVSGDVTALAYRPGKSHLAVAHGEAGVRGVVEVYGILNGNVTTSGQLREFDGHKDLVLGLAFGPDGKTLATCSYDRTVKLWEVDSGKELKTLKEHSDAVYGVAFNKDGTLLATAAADRAVKVWDAKTGKLLYTLGEATDWLYAVAWSPDGTHLAAAGVDKSIRVWEANATGGKLVHSVFAHEAPVIRLAYADDGKTLYSAGEDRIVKAWDVAKMTEGKVYAKQPDNVLALAVRHDHKQLALGRFDGALVLLDPQTGNVAAQPLPVKPKVPQPTGLKPDGGPRGKAAYLTVQGKDLESVTEATSPQPGAMIKVRKGVPPDVLHLEVFFDDKTPPGVYPITLKTAAGQANVHYYVDRFPLVEEREPNDSPGTAQRIDLPASIAGSCHKAGDVDWYYFSVEQGQQLGFQILAKEIGSKLEPFLTLTDNAGNVLATSGDGLLGYTFPNNATYVIGVRDRDFRGADKEMHYRLHVGEIPIVTSVFPLGVQKGKTKKIFLEGVFLGNKTIVEVDARDAAVGTKLPVPLTTPYGPPLGKPTVLVDEYPDVYHGVTDTISVPGVANGRIEKPGATEAWRFAAKKGQKLILEVNARRLGSPLDSYIEILDAKGAPVPRATLRSLAKTYVTFRDHDSAGANIRIEAWSELAVNDYVLVGSELMRIKELPTHPDADCIFFSQRGQRQGFLDTTPSHHAQGTPMYKVAIHPPGTQFPPNGFPVVTLYYRNDDGGPGYGRDSRLYFDPPADGEYQVRIGDSRGQGGPAFAYRLTVRPPRPSYTVSFAPTAPSLWKGGAAAVTVTADRLDGFDGPINVQLDGLPSGFSAPATTIPAGDNSTAFALYADADVTAPPKATALKLRARATIDGQVIAKEATGGVPALRTDPNDIATTTEQSEITLKPGGQVKLKVKVERHNGFAGRIPLEVRGLPHGVRVLDIGLNGILVTEKETERVIVIYAEPWVEAMDHPIVVLAKREGKGTEHAAKSVLLRIAR